MSNILLIARREIIARIKNKAFVVSNVITISLAIGLMLFVKIASSSGNFSAADVFLSDAAKQEQVASAQANEDVLASHGLSYDELAAQVESKKQEILEAQKSAQTAEDSANSKDLYFVGTFVAILLFISLALTGSMIAMGVAEEKSSRIVEILLSSLSSFELMLGKVIGVGIAGLIQIGLLVGSIFIGLQTIFPSTITLPINSWYLLILLLWYIVGYFTYALLFASFASRVSRVEDASQAISPITTFIMIPYFLMVAFPGLVKVGIIGALIRYMPLFSPMGMPIVFVRGEATLVQCLISLAISIIFLPIITLFAAKLYERSILMTGKKVKIFQALKNKK